jgi:hypothetical protein
VTSNVAKSALVTAEVERRAAGLPESNRVTVELNAYAYALLSLVTDKINEDTRENFTLEQAATQMILRELRRVRR